MSTGSLRNPGAVDLIQNRERQGASYRFFPAFFKHSPAAYDLMFNAGADAVDFGVPLAAS